MYPNVRIHPLQTLFFPQVKPLGARQGRFFNRLFVTPQTSGQSLLGMTTYRGWQHDAVLKDVAQHLNDGCSVFPLHNAYLIMMI